MSRDAVMDPSGFVLLADYVPHIVREIRYYSTYNFIGERVDGREIGAEQYENRMRLRRVMLRHGFQPIDCEWWHFALRDEPCPDTYFDFPVSSAYR